MAITKVARAKIFKLVQDIKRLLVKEVASQLQQFYGIRPDGTMLMVEQLPSIKPDVLHTARLLRQRIDYIKSNSPSEKNKDVEAINQLLNEQAFSILNRFATLRMAEERGIIKETIRNEYNSEGFQIFDSITGQGAVAEQFIRYKWYLHSIFDELAIDLPSVFDRFSPYALIFPSESAMRSLLTIINNEQVTMHLEDGRPPVNLWQEDETIGWIYQYYNSREEISEMRDASDAPRNSRELAVRNQFFTPRYVVQFLTDNSLGRIWYEMTKGKTELIHKCQYLIRRPKELFLDKGNSRPENAEEKIDYIEHRILKDPREILMLDPACGSMHFGLYSFDLFEQIYLEAWDNHPGLLLDLRNSITRKQFINQIPEFIIRYNIHGVDIDPRALQIAALSLWLRAQKSFEKLNLEPSERPQITKSNLVLAEAMPGNTELLSELVSPLDAPMRKLVTSIWEMMKMAGETGLLLRIEGEIDRKINEIANDLAKEAKSSQLKITDNAEQRKVAEQAALYATKKYRDSFLENAENEVLRILKQIAETATNGEAYQKLLFADDAARGFAFIELCRKKYDVVLMNPPFGSATSSTMSFLRNEYTISSDNLYIQFIIRCWELLKNNGYISILSDRSFINKSSYEKFRKDFIISKLSLKLILDLGENILDGAFVDVACHIYSKNNRDTIFINALAKESDKAVTIVNRIVNSNYKIFDLNFFKDFPNYALVYDLPMEFIKMLDIGKSVSKEYFESKIGLVSARSVQTNRLTWEPLPQNIGKKNRWTYFQNGSPFSPYYFGCIMVVLSNEFNFKSILSISTARLANREYFLKPGIAFGERTDWMYGYIMNPGQIFSNNGQGIFIVKDFDIYHALLVINSSPFQEIVNHFCGQHKSGYINHIKIDINKFPDHSSGLRGIVRDLEIMDSGNETSLSFICPTSLNFKNVSFESSIKKTVEKRNYISNKANSFRANYNNVVQDLICWIPTEKIAKQNVDYCKVLFDYSNSSGLEISNVISYLLGVGFGRWDYRYAIKNNFEPLVDGLLELPPLSIGSLIEKQTPKDYPIEIRIDGIITIPEIDKLIHRLFNVLWEGNGTKVDDLICLTLDIQSLKEYFEKPNLFFDFHFSRYSKNRRQAPIYWPISTASGSYTIWLYYPKFTDQTLVAVINNYLQPKIDEVINQKKPLEINSNLDNKGFKELKDLNDFVHELEEMKKELLRITALPYKPNHDDGVLITAAPLHNLFRHAKWRKSTEDCWKAMEKGEYDWAHLAYSIWPDRVTKKCKKDLSMAIAHGLEEICEIKPKERKVKAEITPKKSNANPQLNFEE